MFIFIKPGENYIKDGFEWQVADIDKNLVRSKCVGHDISDLEQLDEFNRQVVIGTIQIVVSYQLNADKIMAVK